MQDVKIHNIIRSKRRTVALMINSDATLTVRAPMRVPMNYIEQLIENKISWIRKKISDIQSKPKVVPKEFVDGEEFLYLGQVFRIKIGNSDKISALDGNFHLPQRMLASAAENIQEWYKDEAKGIIEERLALYSRQLSLSYKSIRINGAKRRWGSCSADNRINFSWRLVMAPLYVVDYVVVHELTHIVEKNHSRKFWVRVANVIPEYKKANAWLKNNHALLNIQGKLT